MYFRVEKVKEKEKKTHPRHLDSAAHITLTHQRKNGGSRRNMPRYVESSLILRKRKRTNRRRLRAVEDFRGAKE